jgi:hypothetical protein
MTNADLFQISYTASEARAYFNNIDIASMLHQDPIEELAELKEAFDQDIRDTQIHFTANLVEVNSMYSALALKEDFKLLEAPVYPSDYKDWFLTVMENLLSTVEVADWEHKIINYGFYLGAIAGTIEALKWPLKLQLESPEKAGQAEEIKRLADILDQHHKKMDHLLYFIRQIGQVPALWQKWKNLEAPVIKLISFDLPHKEIKFRKAIKLTESFIWDCREEVRKLIQIL